MKKASEDTRTRKNGRDKINGKESTRKRGRISEHWKKRTSTIAQNYASG